MSFFQPLSVDQESETQCLDTPNFSFFLFLNLVTGYNMVFMLSLNAFNFLIQILKIIGSIFSWHILSFLIIGTKQKYIKIPQKNLTLKSKWKVLLFYNKLLSILNLS